MLVPRPLVEPRGAAWVVVPAVGRNAWGHATAILRHGWQRSGTAAGVVFADGDVSATTAATAGDFVSDCEDCIDRMDHPEDGKAAFERLLKQVDTGQAEVPPLALAAWLHRLGDDARAARIVAGLRRASERRRDRDAPFDPVADLRGDLAWYAFAGMIHAYEVRADDEALADGKRLLDLYGDLAPAQGAQVVAEIERRQREHHDQAPWQEPADWAQRAPAERAAALVAALDGVDARQWGQPGGVGLDGHPLVQALAKLGDAAVPALLDCLDRDPPLTRSVEFWRDFARDRDVLSVRTVALHVLLGQMQARAFAGDELDRYRGGEEGAHALAEKLRAHWTKFRGMTREQRLMAVLTDPRAKPEERGEAADGLAGADGVPYNDLPHRSATPPAAALLAIHDPSVAEAMLTAMDRAMVDGEGAQHRYLSDVVDLGDTRIAATIAARCARAPDLLQRCELALAAERLDATAPMVALAGEFAVGRAGLPATAAARANAGPASATRAGASAAAASGEVGASSAAVAPADWELRLLYQTLADSEVPEADATLHALAAPAHPFHDQALGLVRVRHGGDDDEIWTFSNAVIDLLDSGLDDRRPTGAVWKMENGEAIRHLGDGTSGGSLDQRFSGERMEAEAVERRCDQAAVRLSELMAGLPPYHCLLADRDERLAVIRLRLQVHLRCVRRLYPSEIRRFKPEYAGYGEFGFAPWTGDAPATPADVAQGTALFSLGPGAHLVDIPLPAEAIWHPPGKTRRDLPIMVYQAEAHAAGQRHYGILAADFVGEVPEAEVSGLPAGSILPPVTATGAAATAPDGKR
jgi:hypothetical protein